MVLRNTLISILFFISFPVFAQKPTLVLQTGNTGRVDNMAVSADGKFIANSFGSTKVNLWDIEQNKVRVVYDHANRITDLVFSTVKPILFSSTTDGVIHANNYIDKKGSDFELSGHQGGVNAMALSDDGYKLVSAGNDSTIIVWNLKDNSAEYTFKESFNPFISIALENKKDILYAGDDKGNLLIANYQTGQIEFYNSILKTGIRDLEVVNSTLYVIDREGKIHLFSTEPVKKTLSFSGFSNRGFSLDIRQNLLIATGRDADEAVKYYKLVNQDTLIRYSGDFINEKLSTEDKLYGVADACFVSFTQVAVPFANGDIKIIDLNIQKTNKVLKGLSKAVDQIHITGENILYTSNGQLKRLNLLSLNPIEDIYQDTAVHRSFVDGEDIFLLNHKGDLLKGTMEDQSFSPIGNAGSSHPKTFAFSPGEKLWIEKVSDKKISINELPDGKSSTVKFRNIRMIQVAEKNGYIGLLDRKDQLNLIRDRDFKKAESVKEAHIRTFSISEDGSMCVYFTERPGNKFLKGISRSGKEFFKFSVPDSLRIDQIKISPNNKNIFTYARSVGRYNTKEDYSISAWHMEKGYQGNLSGHTDFVTDITFGKSMLWLVSSSSDGTVRFWSINEHKEELKVIPLVDGEWVALSPEGLFDASPNGMESIHFIFQNQILKLEQMKKSFYEPKLIAKTLGFTEEAISITDLERKYHLYPEIEIIEAPHLNDGILSGKLVDQKGGIGETSILINNKEVVSDVRQEVYFDSASHTFTYNIKDHPYLKRGGVNRISIKAANDRGYQIYNQKNVYFLDERDPQDVGESNLYALIIGISDYEGEELDLKYAAKDARDFAGALQLGAEEYFGKEKVGIRQIISTDNDNRNEASKENIINELESLAEIAQPNDIFIFYMAGHGIDLPEDDEFYFLTSQYNKLTYTNEQTLKDKAISTSELSYYIRRIPALKQLMIVDACHSGNLANSGLVKEGLLGTESIRALENFKDETGTFILASSEGTDVSYESNLLNQGLLTYSLLFGLKGAGLYEGEIMDASNLLQFATRKVPSLAGDIGRRQNPVVKMPDNFSSFQFGRLDSRQREKIDIVPPKPVITRSHFQNKDILYDIDHFGEMLDKSIRDEQAKKELGFIFLDENHFSNAFSVYGQYSKSSGHYNVSYTVFKDEHPIYRSNMKADNLEKAIDMIKDKLLEKIQMLQKQ